MKPSEVLFYCSKCGSSDINRPSSHSLKCQNCGFHFFVNVAAAVGAVIKQDKQILLAKRKNDPKKGFLDFPGGFVEPGETGEEAMVREIKEELNITNITKIEYITTFPNTYNYSGLDVPILDLYFCLEGELTNLRPGDDVEEVVFKRIEAISKEDLAFESNYKILEFIKNNTL